MIGTLKGSSRDEGTSEGQSRESACYLFAALGEPLESLLIQVDRSVKTPSPSPRPALSPGNSPHTERSVDGIAFSCPRCWENMR